MPDVPDALRRSAALCWRLLVVAATAAVAAWLLWHLRIALLPVFVATLLCTALVPLVTRLERRGWRPLTATWAVFGGSLLALVAVVALIVPPTAAELGDLGGSVEQGAQQVGDWLVDGPLGLDRDQVDQVVDDPVGRASDALRAADLSLADGAMMAGQVLAGGLLALVLTFLFLKDGRRFQRWTLDHLPDRHHQLVRSLAGRSWDALGGYLRGAATLGAVEGVIIGAAVWFAGGALAVPIAVLTFFAAFFPIVGAVVAGAIATLVVLATSGPTQAVVVLVVVVVVQQLDNDLLAPFIYGKAVQLHPAVILVALTVGGSLGGIVGAFVAVPVVAVGAAIASVLWERRELTGSGPGGPDRPTGTEDGEDRSGTVSGPELS